MTDEKYDKNLELIIRKEKNEMDAFYDIHDRYIYTILSNGFLRNRRWVENFLLVQTTSSYRNIQNNKVLQIISNSFLRDLSH